MPVAKTTDKPTTSEDATLHKTVGAVFGVFCSAMVVWHLVTPDNPDHLLNLFMHIGLAVFFGLSTLATEKIGFGIQVATLAVGAVLTGSTGSYHAAGAVGAVAALMYYTTSGFVTLGPMQVLTVAGLQVGNIGFGAIMAGEELTRAMGHGAAGTAATLAGLWVFWKLCIVWNRAVVIQNRKLLELSKEILKERECKDGPRS